MDADNLVRMANRIGEFFIAMPDRAEARSGIVRHIREFWEPRMREQLFAHIDREDSSGLAPLVLEAVTEQRSHLMPQRAQKDDLATKSSATGAQSAEGEKQNLRVRSELMSAAISARSGCS